MTSAKFLNLKIPTNLSEATEADLADFNLFLEKAGREDNPWLNFTNDSVFRVAVSAIRRLHESGRTNT